MQPLPLLSSSLHVIAGLLLLCLPCRTLCQLTPDPAGDGLRAEQIRIPMAAAGPAGLQAFLLLPASPGKHPLLLLTHGWEVQGGAIHQLGPRLLGPEAFWFARRGWAVAIVMRRGFGASGGQGHKFNVNCKEQAFDPLMEDNAADLQAAYDSLSGRSDVDGDRVVVAGVSMGGLAAVALGAKAPSGLKAVINLIQGPHMLFTGGCLKHSLAPTLARLGRDSSLPELWVYTTNRPPFPADAVKEMQESFQAAGGHAEFVSVPAIDGQGHPVFDEHLQVWEASVQGFLAKLNLPAQPLTPDPEPLKILANFAPEATAAFRRFQSMGSYKAFATGPNGKWGYAGDRESQSAAERYAIYICNDPKCVVIAHDREPSLIDP